MPYIRSALSPSAVAERRLAIAERQELRDAAAAAASTTDPYLRRLREQELAAVRQARFPRPPRRGR
jgi:hypothetical protein